MQKEQWKTSHRFKLDADVADFNLQLHLILLELGGTDSRLLRLVLQLSNACCHLAATLNSRLAVVVM